MEKNLFPSLIIHPGATPPLFNLGYTFAILDN